jgi:hypothetical protein
MKNEKPLYKVGDKLKITQEFLDKTKWSANDNYDYLRVESFRSYISHEKTPIIDGDYAKYYIISGNRINPHYYSGDAFRFYVWEINMLPKYE